MPKIGKKSFDTRVVARNLHDNNIRKDYEKHLKSLPDDAENADWTRPGEEQDSTAPELEVVS